jgi:gluconokinase
LSRSLILAIDTGTSSVRAALYDLQGKLLPKTFVKYERTLESTADGGAEIDADEAFRQVVRTIDGVLSRSENIKADVVAVSACAFWHSLLGVDAKGRPTTKALGWADTRSAGCVAQLRKRSDETEVHNRTGARFHSSFWPAKLLWFQKKRPSIFSRTAKWLSLSDYIFAKLTGDVASSVSMASATGIFDIRRCAWDSQLIKTLKLRPEDLPGVISDTAFQLSLKLKKRWPRLAAAKWFPAIGDGAGNNIGSGCVSRSRAALMIGTSGAVRVAYRGGPPPKIPSGLWCYRIDRDRVVLGGALSDGGGLYQWLHNNLRLDPGKEAEVVKRDPDGHGLTFLPFLAGERSTGYHEFAKGAVLGLTASTNAVDITQAAMEGVAFRFAEIFDELKSVVRIDEIVASGGALRDSAIWTQIIADVLGREISLIGASEASMRGAVLLATESLGNIDSIERIPPVTGRTILPDRGKHAIYRKARERHRRFYDLLIQNRVTK